MLSWVRPYKGLQGFVPADQRLLVTTTAVPEGEGTDRPQSLHPLPGRETKQLSYFSESTYCKAFDYEESGV